MHDVYLVDGGTLLFDCTFQDNQLVERFVFKMNGLTEEALRYVYYNYSSLYTFATTKPGIEDNCLIISCYHIIRKDEHLLLLEDDLQATLMKIGVCDAMLEPNPPGKHLANPLTPLILLTSLIPIYRLHIQGICSH